MRIIKFGGIFLLFVAAAYFGMILLAPSEVSFQVNEDINAPIEEVYTTYTTAEDMGKWMKGVKQVKTVPGKDKPTVDIYYEGKGEMIMRHTALVGNAPSEYSCTNEVKDFFKRDEQARFEVVDSTTTRVKLKVKITALSTRMKLFMYAEDTHKNNMATNLSALKTLLEK